MGAGASMRPIRRFGCRHGQSTVEFHCRASRWDGRWPSKAREYGECRLKHVFSRRVAMTQWLAGSRTNSVISAASPIRKQNGDRMPTIEAPDTAEELRLNEARETGIPWRSWGPYLSERQWGTVREDYSTDGNAWDYFSHDQARSRAYHWGEDGLAGISDDQQRLCFALALWNGKDPIIKERLFGLTNSEGNHGEDVKECYFYLDSTPTHSYMKYLYKYPQNSYPYDEIVTRNAQAGRAAREYELLDTGVFNDDRYFDVFVEYAKASVEDVLLRITVENRGPEAATLHVLPTIWFRNRWAWTTGVPRPALTRGTAPAGAVRITLDEQMYGRRELYCGG